MMTKKAKSATNDSMRPRSLKVFFDGGCRPNPGNMETAVVVRGVTYIQSGCGIGSNNDAEWLALIHAAEIARSIGTNDIILIGDSQMVIGQANRTAVCRSAKFAAYLRCYEALVADFARVKIRHISRSQNLAGIALAMTRR